MNYLSLLFTILAAPVLAQTSDPQVIGSAIHKDDTPRAADGSSVATQFNVSTDWSFELQVSGGARQTLAVDRALDVVRRHSSGADLRFPTTTSTRTILVKPTQPLSRRQVERLYRQLQATDGVEWVRVRNASAERVLANQPDGRKAVGLILAPVVPDVSGAIENGNLTPYGLQTLREITGYPFERSTPIAGGLISLRFVDVLSGDEAERIRRMLDTVKFLQWADLDVIDETHNVPNDTFYANQWNLSGPWGINGPQAWDISTGSPSVVVAVIDTGILKTQPDLSSRIIGGYDFITDPTQARDGNGPDADASDEGNWREIGDCGSTVFRPSNWHGSHVAGIIGAASNNNYGIAGVAWDVRIVPIRVLGKCGGARSDIINGMYWAVGLSVPGAPANPNPARILNMSLGTATPTFTCSPAYQTAISAVRAAGGIIVVAAGNNGDTTIGESGFYEPSGCPGVIVVGASDHQGYRSSYSNWSTLAVVDVSAPGGDISYYHDQTVGIYSTVDIGSRTPQGPGGAWMQGTSQAAPHVAGTLALMLSAKPSLTNDQLYWTLIETARDFNTLSSCYRDSICGWGVTNAHAALLRATSSPANGPTEVTLMSSANPITEGQAFTLTATVSPSNVTGTISFMRDWTPLAGCTNLTLVAGAASCKIAGWPATGLGYTFQAGFSGDYTHHWNNSDDLVQLVLPAGGANYQGLWWNPAESGWGVNLAHQGDSVFATWYTYDIAGNAAWLSMLANRSSPASNTYSGSIYVNYGPPLFNYVGSGSPNQIGNGTLTFSDSNNALLSYAVNIPTGLVTQSKAITRFNLGTGPQVTCVYGAASALASATNYQDLWWVPGGSESGWGVNFAHQGNTIYATWYTYDIDGSPLWLSGLLQRFGVTNTYTGPLLRTAGPRFDNYHTSDLKPTVNVGSANVTFAGGNSATFTYTVQLSGMGAPVTQSKSLTRFLFAASTGTVCH